MDWLWGRCQGMVNLEPRLGLGDVPWGALWGDLCGSLGYGDICFVFDCAVRFVGILVPQPGIEPPDPWS